MQILGIHLLQFRELEFLSSMFSRSCSQNLVLMLVQVYKHKATVLDAQHPYTYLCPTVRLSKLAFTKTTLLCLLYNLCHTGLNVMTVDSHLRVTCLYNEMSVSLITATNAVILTKILSEVGGFCPVHETSTKSNWFDIFF